MKVTCAILALAGMASAHNFQTPDSADPMAYMYKLIAKNKTDPAALAAELASSPLAAVVNWTSTETPPRATASAKPVVTAHGMGDSCFNPGMKEITTDVGKHLGVYSVCVPTGGNQIMDTIDGFLMNMDKSIDVFAKKIKADKNLADGFDCIGFSQGNSLCRGYIQKYNDPPVRNFLSVHGTVMGVSGMPQCNPDGGLLSPVCDGLAKLLGTLAFNKLVQGILFQADYFRDPFKLTSDDYLKNSQLAALNNEGASPSAEYKTNFLKTEQFVMVKAMGDTMVFPNEGEHWGCFKPNSYKEVLPMNQTDLYTKDLFGLKTADEAGKIHFEHTAGNHLEFTETQLFGWIDTYF